MDSFLWEEDFFREKACSGVKWSRALCGSGETSMNAPAFGLTWMWVGHRR